MRSNKSKRVDEIFSSTLESGVNTMTNDKRKGSISPVAAAVTGAVIGAGAAVAGAAILRDEKNRAKVEKTLNKVKDQARGYIKKLEKSARQAQEEAESKNAQGKREVKEMVKKLIQNSNI